MVVIPQEPPLNAERKFDSSVERATVLAGGLCSIVCNNFTPSVLMIETTYITVKHKKDLRWLRRAGRRTKNWCHNGRCCLFSFGDRESNSNLWYGSPRVY